MSGNALLAGRGIDVVKTSVSEVWGIAEMRAFSTRDVVAESAGTQALGPLQVLGHLLTGSGAPIHDLRNVLVQAMLMIAGDGDSCADIEAFA